MPPTNDTSHRHAKKASPGRRKAKPKFEIPVEAAPETATAWVYRADEVREHPAPRQVETARAIDEATPNPFLAASMGIIFLGVGTMGLISVAALSMLTVPLRVARNIWGD
jgi:hypothetical protein